MNNRIFTLCFVLFLSSWSLLAQHSPSASEHSLTNSSADHPPFRVSVLIGHTLIKSEGADSYLFVPSWGLDLEYWFGHTWGVGLHNDIEIESFIIRNSDEEEIERVNPLVFTLDLLYRFHNGVVLSVGPGAEYESGESFYLARFGVEYEYEIGNGYDISPSVFYDQRLDGFATYTIALGVGKRF